MLEVELKAALLPEQADVLPNVLAALHFAEQAAVQETDIYFNAPDRDFQKTDEALRLRTHKLLSEGKTQTLVTYKGAKLGAKSSTRRELETAVEDFETMRQLFCALGYKPVFTVTKKRRSFTCGAKTVCLDDVTGLGAYLELESVLPDGADCEAAVQELLALLDTLGVARSALTRESYYSLIKQFMRIASANWTLGKKLMKVIHAQEQALVFEKFMNEDAYQIGTKIKQGVEKLGHDVVDSISLGDEQLFYYAMQSIRPINLS